MSFEDVVSNGIPLHDASRFFISLKKLAAQPTEPPDETGALEGKFSVPVEQVLAAMGEQVRNEFETHMSYKVYAQTLRDLSHYAIAEHFEDHCGDEMDHADFLLRRMAALGGPANVPDVQAPFPSADPVDIIKKMIRMEQEAVSNWRNLRQLVGDENPTSIAIDDYMLKEQEHIDDLWQLLPHTERSAVVSESVGSAPPAPAPAQAPAQAPPTPAAQPATQPVASAEKTSSADLQKAAFAMKLAYYGGYYRGRVGKHVGLQSDLAGLKEASLKMRFIKAAAELLDSATETPAPAAAAPAEAMGGPSAPDANAGSFLAQEQMMQQAQDTNEANYYKKKFETAQQALQAAQQQQQAQQQQMDQMNQQLQSMQQQIDGSVQQNQQVQQQAMQNAQSAQAAATQAMQQTLAANSELLSQQQLSANMRNAYQQLQQQVMQVAQAAPPPATTMEAGASQAAAMGTPPQTGPGEMAGGAGGEPGTGAGQPGGDAGASAGPVAGPPPGDQGAAAPGGEQAAPPAPTAEGANMAPQGDQTAPQPEIAQAAKQGSANDLEKYLMLDGEKFASFLSDASSRVGDLAKQHAPAVIGAGIGAAGGAVLPFALTGGEEQLAALRQRVADRYANKDELGWRDELNQIKDKSMLGMEEFAQHHPVATHVMGALTGAGVGAGTGTAVGELLKSRKLDPAGY